MLKTILDLEKTMTTLINQLKDRTSVTTVETLITGVLTISTFAGMYAMITNL